MDSWIEVGEVKTVVVSCFDSKVWLLDESTAATATKIVDGSYAAAADVDAKIGVERW